MDNTIHNAFCTTVNIKTHFCRLTYWHCIPYHQTHTIKSIPSNIKTQFGRLTYWHIPRLLNECLRFSPAMFDDAKLRWLNGQHLRAMPLKPLLPLVLNRAISHKDAAELVLRAGARGPHGKRPSTREWQRGF